MPAEKPLDRETIAQEQGYLPDVSDSQRPSLPPSPPSLPSLSSSPSQVSDDSSELQADENRELESLTQDFQGRLRTSTPDSPAPLSPLHLIPTRRQSSQQQQPAAGHPSHDPAASLIESADLSPEIPQRNASPTPSVTEVLRLLAAEREKTAQEKRRADKAVSEKEQERQEKERERQRADAAERREREALARPERLLSLQDCETHVNTCLLEHFGERADNDTSSSLHTTTEIRKPHMLRRDLTLHQNVSQFSKLLESLFGERQCIRYSLSSLEQVAEDLRGRPTTTKKDMEIFLANMLWLSFKILYALDEIVAPHHAGHGLAGENQCHDGCDEEQHKLAVELFSMFPTIPWGNLQGSLLKLHEAPRPSNTLPRRRGSASTSHASSSSTALEDLSQASERRMALSSSDLDSAVQRSSAKLRGKAPQMSDDLPKGRLGIFVCYKSQHSGDSLISVLEAKKYNPNNAKKLEGVFGQASSQPEDLNSMRVSGSKNSIKQRSIAERSQQQREESCDCIASGSIPFDTIPIKDVQKVTQQCFKYILCHKTPFVSLATGLAQVFLRYDHQQVRSCGHTHLLFYLISARPDVSGNAYDGWKEESMLHANLYWHLLALSDFEATSEEERDAWVRELNAAAPRGLNQGSRSSSPTAVRSPTAPVKPVSRSHKSRSDEGAGGGGGPSQPRRQRQTQRQQGASTSNHQGAGRLTTAHSQNQTSGNERKGREYKDSTPKQWCTAHCLLGLKYNLNMDPKCHNADLHCTLANCTDHSSHKHLYSLEHVKNKIKDQLNNESTWEEAIEGISGCHGTNAQLFRLSDPVSGYAFAARSETGDGDMQQEHEVYEHIVSMITRPGESIQRLPAIDTFVAVDGKSRVPLHVPVSCGVIQIDRIISTRWQDDDDDEGEVVQFTKFLLLSYHSENLNHQDSQNQLNGVVPVAWRDTACRPAFRQLRTWCDKALNKRAGVEHNDLYPRNMLWCKELRGIVVIDFEFAKTWTPLHRLAFMAPQEQKHPVKPTQHNRMITPRFESLPAQSMHLQPTCS